MVSVNAGTRGLASMLNGNYQTYNVSWTAASANPSLGNGTLVGQWSQAAGLVFFNIYLLGGSSTTGGTGNYALSLPVAAKSVAGGAPAGSYSGILDHSGAAPGMASGVVASGASVIGISGGSGYIAVAVGTSGVVQWSSSSPFAISGANFTFEVGGWYESS